MSNCAETLELRRQFRAIAVSCVGQVNDIRKLAGRLDRYTMREFIKDTHIDLDRAGADLETLTPAQWLGAAKRRARDIGA